jgi:hypothetical protein
MAAFVRSVATGVFQNFGLSSALPLNPQEGKDAYNEILKYIRCIMWGKWRAV